MSDETPAAEASSGRGRLSTENVISLAGAVIAVVFGALGIWQTQVQKNDAARSSEQAAHAAERAQQQTLVITTQDKFAEDLATFADVLENKQRQLAAQGGQTTDEGVSASKVKEMIKALAYAKTEQRDARAAILAGRYEEAADHFATAYRELERVCPGADIACARTIG